MADLTDQVRYAWCWYGGATREESDRRTAEFDRWLAAHDRQVRAQALRDAADELERLDDNPLIRPLVANSQGATAMHEYALATIRDRADAEERGDQ